MRMLAYAFAAAATIGLALPAAAQTTVVRSVERPHTTTVTKYKVKHARPAHRTVVIHDRGRHRGFAHSRHHGYGKHMHRGGDSRASVRVKIN